MHAPCKYNLKKKMNDQCADDIDMSATTHGAELTCFQRHLLIIEHGTVFF